MTPAEKIIVVEKQASSEIAQSRERFEKWGNAKGTMGDSWDGHHYENILHECAWQAWEQAERDTRERCAQIAEQWEVNQFLPAGSLKKLAERIRGKE